MTPEQTTTYQLLVNLMGPPTPRTQANWHQIARQLTQTLESEEIKCDAKSVAVVDQVSAFARERFPQLTLEGSVLSYWTAIVEKHNTWSPRRITNADAWQALSIIQRHQHPTTITR